jgi:long-chain acyl-CoA synthetase
MFSTTAGCSKYVSAHWISLAHGAMSQSMAVVTAYDTLGEEALRHSLVATKAKAIFLEPHLLKTVIGTLKDAKSIEHIILNSGSELEVSDEDLSTLKKFYEHVNLLTFEDLRRLGEENLVDPTPPSPDDLCCIMYTSGSGGTPKGVELKHKNVVASGMSFPQAASLLTCGSGWNQRHSGRLRWS